MPLGEENAEENAEAEDREVWSSMGDLEGRPRGRVKRQLVVLMSQESIVFGCSFS